jgi:hypothetical protein
LEHPKNYRRIPHLLYIDTDPVVTQIKIALSRAEFLERVETHDTHFSFGKVEKDADNPRYILTEHGFGYRFEKQPDG